MEDLTGLLKEAKDPSDTSSQ
jgi:tetratricopeptide (TPR) repeat protein